MPKGFFVTGTDTGVGKTVISGLLLRALNMLGMRACGMKPVETGCIRQSGVLMPSDAMFLKNVAHMDEPVTRIVSYCMEAPLSPMAASEMEGVTIEPEKIKKDFHDLTQRYDAVVVEGVGGLLAPITRQYYVADMAKDLGLPVIIVARASLGTINHTLLTLQYGLGQGLKIAGIIINFSRPPDGSLAEETSPHTIKILSPVPVIGIVPYLTDMGNETLDKTVIKNLDLGAIKEQLSHA